MHIAFLQFLNANGKRELSTIIIIEPRQEINLCILLIYLLMFIITIKTIQLWDQLII